MIQISPDQTLRQARNELDRLYLQHHLERNGWRLGMVAKFCGIDRCHLYRIAHRLGIPIGYETVSH